MINISHKESLTTQLFTGLFAILFAGVIFSIASPFSFYTDNKLVIVNQKNLELSEVKEKINSFSDDLKPELKEYQKDKMVLEIINLKDANSFANFLETELNLKRVLLKENDLEKNKEKGYRYILKFKTPNNNCLLS